MTIINNSNWDKVQIELNNHETLLLLQSLKSEVEQAQETLPEMKEALKPHSDMVGMIEACLKVANDKVKLHNELLAAYRSDYEHLKLEPIKLD